MKTRNYFEYVRDFPHTLGIFLTYTLDPEILRHLRENAGGRTVVLHDYRQGVSLEDNYNSRLLLIPMFPGSQHVENCFHAKLALLKGEDGIRLVTGSLNLSRESFVSPKEVCCCLDIPFESALYKGALKFFEDLTSHLGPVPGAIQKWKGIIEELKSHATTSAPQSPDSAQFVFNTTKTTIATQITDYLSVNAPKRQPIVSIASPFLSDNYKTDFGDFIRDVRAKEVRLYSRRRQSRLPLGLGDIRFFSPKNKAVASFHAKMLAFDYGNTLILYVGSANCTKQGFFGRPQGGGNNECGIVYKCGDRTALLEWFKKGNWQEEDLAKLASLPTKPNETDFEPPEAWAWCERFTGSNSRVTVYLYLPKAVMAKTVRVDGRRVRLTGGESPYNIFSAEVRVSPKAENLTLKIAGKELKLAIYDQESFETARRDDGDSLFRWDGEMRSIRPEELERAIRRDGVSVPGTDGIIMREPPKLEEYYKNVRRICRAIAAKKFYSVAHENELKSELATKSGGMGLYLISHLYKSFSANKNQSFAEHCVARARKVCETDGILDFAKYKKFLRRWA